MYRHARGLVRLVIFLACSTLAATAFGQTPTVTTDRDDYAPGQTVVITGSGWMPGETVSMLLYEEPWGQLNRMLSSVADSLGNFTNAEFSPEPQDVGAAFTLVATGETSGWTAQVYFTDASVQITRIGFNPANQPASFAAGVPNDASTPLRVQTQNNIGVGETVTGNNQSATVQVTSSSPTGRFDTNPSGGFTATTLTLQIGQNSQNTPDFFYKDVTAGSVTLSARVTTRTSGLANLPLNFTATLTKSVDKVNSTTTLASSGSPTTYGQNVTFSATVQSVTSGTGTPTGTVTFKDGAADLGTATLASGSATLTTSLLAATSHSITAVYNGDTTFNASTSAALAHVVNKATLTVTAGDASREYGSGNPAFTASFAGFENGESLGTSGVTGSPNLTTSAGPSSPVGGSPYAIVAALGTLSAGNYAFSFANGSLNVTKATLTVTADDASREYGDANPSFTASFTGFKNGESLATSGVSGSPSLSTSAGPSSPVGGSPYAIVAALGTLSAGNYAFSFANGSLSITKATLIVAANDTSRNYGEANPVFTATFAGFKNSESLATSDVSGSPSLTTSADASSPVGASPYAIVAALGTLDSGNYGFSFVDGSLTVTKATVTVTANDASREYGEANPTFTVAFVGFKNSESFATSDITGNPSLTTSADPSSPVGGSPYTIVPALGTLSADNYAFSFVNGNLTITKATVSVTADDASREYGDANPAFSASLGGFKNGETLATSGVSGSPSLTTSAGPSSPVGPYSIVAALGTLSAGNYGFNFANGSLSVTKAMLTVTADDASREYGEANPAFTASFAGFKNSESLATSGVSGSPSLTTSAGPASPVGGSPYAIVAALGTLSAGNYGFSFANGSLSVTKATLTVTADDASREYGDANPTLTASFGGFKNGESLATSGVSGSPSVTTSAGSSSPVGGSPYAIVATLGTLGAGNYGFSFANGSLNVTKATLTVTAEDASREYGEANPSFTADFAGFKNGESLATSGVSGSPSLTTSAGPSSPVGGSPYPIVAAIGTLSAGNYGFSFANGSLSVTKATLTVTADDASREYGEANPALTASFGGFKNGESLATSGVSGSPSLTTSAGPSSPVGPYAIVAALGTLSAGNYGFSFANGSLNVTKATLTVTADDASREYGEANPSFTADFAGFKNGETLATSGVSGSPSLTTSAGPSSPVGGSPYAIVAALGTLGAGNYGFNFVNGSLTVTRATLTVTADDASREYGAANPAFTASFGGFKNGESFATSGVGGSPSLTTSADPSSPVGGSPYAIVAALGTLSAGNYGFNFVNGSLTVTKATLTVTADDASREYGEGNPTFTASFGGFKNGESLATSGVSGSPSLTTSAGPSSPVGGSPYAIVAALGTLGAGNYEFAFANGSLTVSRAPLSVKTNDASKVYGAPLPAFTVSYSGFVLGEGPGALGGSLTFTGATAASPVGPHAITPSGLTSGNYQVTFLAGTLTVTQAPLTVTAENKSKVFGAALPAFTVTYAGFVLAEDSSVLGGTLAFTTPATASSPVGTYPITPSDLTSGNYAITFAGGTLTITPAATTSVVTVTASSQQYSDRVTLEATLSPGGLAGIAPAMDVTFTVGTQVVGIAHMTASAGVLKGTLADVPLVEPSPFGTAPTGQMAPGTHSVTAAFSGIDPNFTVSNATTTLTVTPEDARTTYSGALFVSTSGTTTSTANVTLSATIQDMTAANAIADPACGDIRNAKVTFIDRDTNTPINSTPLSVGLVSPGDTKTGVVTYNWNVNIGTAVSQSFTVGVIVSNYYSRNESSENTVVTVSKPGKDFISGGGYLSMATSSGLYPGEPGTKNNFGFNVKYNKSGTNLQGNINSIVRNGGQVYQIKGNAMTSLSVNSTTGKATFNGKANIQNITNPVKPVAIDGNASLQVTMTDNGEPGSGDLIAITVWNKDGGLWFSSSWDGTKTVEQALAGGNLQVKSGGSTTIAKASSESPDVELLPQRYALSQNVPNPFNPSTAIRFDLPEASHVRLVVYDALGRQVVELVRGMRPAGRYQEVWQGRDASGRAVPSGMYFAHIEAASVSSASRLSSTRKMLLLQ